MKEQKYQCHDAFNSKIYENQLFYNLIFCKKKEKRFKKHSFTSHTKQIYFIF